MDKKEKKWFRGGGPFSKINRLTSDLQMISATRELVFDMLPFNPGDLLDLSRAPWLDDDGKTK